MSAPDAVQVLADQKEAAELAKLRLEVDALRAKAGKRKWVGILVASLLSSFGAGAGGYFFGDSLRERSHAAIRQDVLRTYFSTENSAAGKRRQILTFLDGTLAEDDPLLRAWTRAEIMRVDQRIAEIKAELTRTEAEIAAMEATAGSSQGELVPPADGLLSAASLAAMKAHDAKERAVQRAKILRESLLCLPLPDPPPGTVDDSNPRAARERFGAERESVIGPVPLGPQR